MREDEDNDSGGHEQACMVSPPKVEGIGSEEDARAVVCTHCGGTVPQVSLRPAKKQKLCNDGSGSEEEAGAVVCLHCGGPVPQVSLRVASLDGAALAVTVARRGLVREVKLLVAQVRVRSTPTHATDVLFSVQLRDLDPDLIDLFIDGKEDRLPDSGRLDDLGLRAGSVVFMLQRLGWCWQEHGSRVMLTRAGLVATALEHGWRLSIREDKLVAGGPSMTDGRHYWEVQVTWAGSNRCAINVGAMRSGLGGDLSDIGRGGVNPDGAYYIIDGFDGALYDGNHRVESPYTLTAASPPVRRHPFEKGDRIGVLLDLDAGLLHIYRNGVLCGPPFRGVTGPLVRIVQLYHVHDQATAVLGAIAPEGGSYFD